MSGYICPICGKEVWVTFNCGGAQANGIVEKGCHRQVCGDCIVIRGRSQLCVDCAYPKEGVRINERDSANLQHR